MEMMERYIYAVTKYLPETQRKDVAMELRANILDMLPDDPSEEEILQALQSLGSPRKLSEEYATKKRYLIGPSYYNKYLEVLKLVVTIVMIVLLAVNLLSFVLGTSTESFGFGDIAELIGTMISSSISGGLQAAFWVTLSFVILERTAADEGYHELFKKDWSPKDLDPVPSSTTHKVSKVEAVVGLVFTVIFVVFLYTGSDKFGIFWIRDGGTMENIPIFNMERLQTYLPIFLVFAGAQVILFIWQMVKEYWDMPMALYNLFFEVAFMVLILVILVDGSLLNPELYTELQRSMGLSPEITREWLTRSKIFAGVLIVVLSLIDGIGTILKVRKGLRKNS